MLLLWSSWLSDDLLFIIFLFLCFEASGGNAQLAPCSCLGWSSPIWAVLPTPTFYLEIICVDCVRLEVPTVLSHIVVAAMLTVLNLLTHLTWKPVQLLPPETPRTTHQLHVVCQRKYLAAHLPARSSSAFFRHLSDTRQLPSHSLWASPHFQCNQDLWFTLIILIILLGSR